MADKTLPAADNIEELLTGGNVSKRVVRIGRTVRKPVTDATPSVEAFLKFLHTAGLPAAPLGAFVRRGPCGVLALGG